MADKGQRNPPVGTTISTKGMSSPGSYQRQAGKMLRAKVTYMTNEDDPDTDDAR